MNILAVNFNHDGSAVLLRDGRIAAYVNTERYSRFKKHPGVREQDLVELLDQAALTPERIDHAILCNRGANYPEVIERYRTDFRDGWVEYALAPDERRVRILGVEIPCHVNPPHFLCHAALAYYFSPFDGAVSLACDPLGSGAYLGTANRLTRLDVPSCHIGAVYCEVSRLLGFGALYGAGKTMGLSPYGTVDDAERGELERLCSGGVTGERVPALVGAIRSLGEKRPVFVEERGKRWNATQAALVQEALEIALDGLLEELFDAAWGRASRSDGVDLCLSGGTALNSVANEKCHARSRFDGLYLHPACGDDGTAIGAALHHWHHVLGNGKLPHAHREAMYGIRTYPASSVDAAVARFDADVEVVRTDAWIERAADALARGAIVGWFDGASEIGPRALGHRSILANPTLPGMKDAINQRVKFRERFRPFAPAVLEDHAETWFGLPVSPFMLRVAPVLKDGVPAVTHHDRTARIQTVGPEDDPRFFALLSAFFQRTGVPMVLNTSFNVGGEPIVETPEHALRSFLACDLDVLVFPGMIVTKRKPERADPGAA
jgi:carbamoyltransferase